MLQDPTHPAIVVPARPVAPAIAPLPLMPDEPDYNEHSLDNLAALADIAYRVGDYASAEQFVRRLYAQRDHQLAKTGQNLRQRTGGHARQQVHGAMLSSCQIT